MLQTRNTRNACYTPPIPRVTTMLIHIQCNFSYLEEMTATYVPNCIVPQIIVQMTVGCFELVHLLPLEYYLLEKHTTASASIKVPSLCKRTIQIHSLVYSAICKGIRIAANSLCILGLYRCSNHISLSMMQMLSPCFIAQLDMIRHTYFIYHRTCLFFFLFGYASLNHVRQVLLLLNLPYASIVLWASMKRETIK